jgi:uncharacterized membrane protein YhaH (DUF805 family)
MELMFQPIRKYADFSGRARRKEFWLFALLMFLIEIAFMGLLSAVGGSPMMLVDPALAPATGASGTVLMIYGLVLLALLIPSIAVAIRRLHDTNRRGWWILIGLIPLIGQLVLFIFYLLDGTPGPNRFGPDPKARSELAPA